MRLGAILVAVMGLAACKAAPGAQGEALAETVLPPPPVWQTIEPGGETLCANGTPYRFHVREGDADKVMIFLNGGGACWTGDHCSLDTEPTPYTPFAEMDANNPALMGGVFNSSNPANPFAGWTQVFVPYCTGDVHLGTKDVTYTTSAGGEITIHHRGKANVQSALDWVYANREAPSSIFVGGGSAGAIASAYYAGVVADHYPQADIVQHGDGAGGYRAAAISGILGTWGAFDNLPDWPGFASLDPATGTAEDFYRQTAAQHPRVQMSQFNNVDDEVQQMFLALMGVTDPVRGLMRANMEDLTAEIPGFRYFSAKGTDHTMLRFDRFYETEAEGASAPDWLRALAGGIEVASVTCEDEAACD
ncbi:MAG TPA: pectin acetylesterase-family hydrolase [Hyphomonas sp.]|nr:pectin acetylesterase-family hydrolase [Hyphomonas sp.]